jgi:hypothetical protein
MEFLDGAPPMAESLLRALSMVHLHTLGTWITTVDGKMAEADQPYPEVPKICISPAFGTSAEPFPELAPKLSFLYIVQGLSCAAKMKAVLTPDPKTAATGMLHEASNGYNITLSGAVHTDVAKILEYQFVRVGTWREVVDEGEKLLFRSSWEGMPSIRVPQGGPAGKLKIHIYC